MNDTDTYFCISCTIFCRVELPRSLRIKVANANFRDILDRCSSVGRCAHVYLGRSEPIRWLVNCGRTHARTHMCSNWCCLNQFWWWRLHLSKTRVQNYFQSAAGVYAWLYYKITIRLKVTPYLYASISLTLSIHLSARVCVCVCSNTQASFGVQTRLFQCPCRDIEGGTCNSWRHRCV